MNKIYIKNMGYIPVLIYQRKNNNNLSFTFDKTISKASLKSKISNYNYLNTFLKLNNTVNIYSIPAKQLLSPINFDIFIKYLYFKNYNNSYIKKLYLAHIKILNNYKEPDGSKKSKKDYLLSNKILLKDFNNGFDENKSIIPLSNQNIIIDGAHRIALSVIKNSNISCFKTKINDLNFDFTYFKNKGYPKKYLDLTALIIIEIINDISCFIYNYKNKKDLLKIIVKVKNDFDVYYYKILNNSIIFIIDNPKKEKYYHDLIIINDKKEIFKLFSLYLKKSVYLKFNTLEK